MPESFSQIANWLYKNNSEYSNIYWAWRIPRFRSNDCKVHGWSVQCLSLEMVNSLTITEPGPGECWAEADDLNPINVAPWAEWRVVFWKQERPLGHSSLLSRADNDVNSKLKQFTFSPGYAPRDGWPGHGQRKTVDKRTKIKYSRFSHWIICKVW